MDSKAVGGTSEAVRGKVCDAVTGTREEVSDADKAVGNLEITRVTRSLNHVIT